MSTRKKKSDTTANGIIRTAQGDSHGYRANQASSGSNSDHRPSYTVPTPEPKQEVASTMSFDEDLQNYLSDNMVGGLSIPTLAKSTDDPASEKDLDQLFEFVNSMGELGSTTPTTASPTVGGAPVIQIDRAATLELQQQQVIQQQTIQQRRQQMIYQQQQLKHQQTQQAQQAPQLNLPRLQTTRSNYSQQSVSPIEFGGADSPQLLLPTSTQTNYLDTSGSYSDRSASTTPYLSASETPYDDSGNSAPNSFKREVISHTPDAEMLFSPIEHLSISRNPTENEIMGMRLAQPLTESNLQRQADILQAPGYDTDGIIQDPGKVARHTPSLFSSRSGSSNHSGMLEGPTIMVENASEGESSNAGIPVGSGNSKAGTNVSQTDISESYSYLSLPQDVVHEDMRLGRQRRGSASSRSTSRSSSRSRTSIYEETRDENGNVTYKLTRERLSDLAAPASSKKGHKNPAIYACRICNKKFTRPYNLKSHLRTHTNERPYTCSVCGKAFARQHDRKRHEDLHSGEKRFQCRGTLADGTEWGCGKRFARTDALRRHFQTESGKECIRPLLQEIAKESGTDVNPDSSDFDPILAAMQNAQRSVGL